MIAGAPYECEYCPCWLVRQRAVVEATAAYAAAKHGALLAYYPDGENTVLEAALEVERSFNLYEGAKSEQLKRKSQH